MTDAPDDRRTRRNIAVLVTAQAVLGSQITMVFVIGGLAGQQLAPNPCLATLPITLIFVGNMSTAPWLSALMQRHGRRAGFLAGATGGLIGSALAAAGVASGSFWLLVAGAYFTGVYMSAQGFYRFAATDTASDAFRPKAISYVLAGGLISALIGPQLVSLMTNTPIATPDRYLPVYYAAMALNLFGMGLFFLLDLPLPPRAATGAPTGRSRIALLRDPNVGVAILCAVVSYALMNLMMTSAPLAVVGGGFAVADAANVVSAHVLAMYVPSFFTGHLIARFGAHWIIATGLALLFAAGMLGLSGVALPQFFGALILLGLGWNFGFIGATSLLTAAHAPHERGRAQGLNDMLVFGTVTLSSLASGGLMNCTGGTPEAGWSAVSLAMIPFLTLAGAALIWLTFRARRAG